jgi:hypothetical protein
MCVYASTLCILVTIVLDIVGFRASGYQAVPQTSSRLQKVLINTMDMFLFEFRSILRSQ